MTIKPELIIMTKGENMKRIIFLGFIAFSASAFSGTLNCTSKDLATGDVMAELNVSDIQLNRDHEFIFGDEFIESSVSFKVRPENRIQFAILSKSDNQEEFKETSFLESDFDRDLLFVSTSVASASLNLDTLYTQCRWKNQ